MIIQVFELMEQSDNVFGWFFLLMNVLHVDMTSVYEQEHFNGHISIYFTVIRHKMGN